NDEEDEYFLPLQDQRVFGAGIRKKRVPFVRSSDLTTTTTSSSTPTPSSTGQTIADRYLSLVLSTPPPPLPLQQQPKPDPSNPNLNLNSNPQQHPPTPTPPEPEPEPQPHCEICNLPLTTQNQSQTQSQTPQPKPKPHEASLAHQACLTHSHPPSHLDRTRPGMRYLAAYGWDPDSRVGLGASGREGIREPVKGRLKADTVGLGAVVPRGGEKEKNKKKKKTVGGAGVQKLNAKEVRKGQNEERRRGERLREMFFQREDVLEYLGGG
ncbi:hypothetical protein BO70DRAFT_258823, partial [Aspergillus heteromorphus CBS 117.55]